MKMYVGIDYHKRWSEFTILSESGEEVARGRVENEEEKVREFLRRHIDGVNAEAVLEATDSWEVMYDWLEGLVEKVHLAHPLNVRLISESRIKTDRIDSEVLAHLLRTRFLPEAHIPSREVREVRRLVRHRIFLVSIRTRLKNRVRSLLRRYPKEMRKSPVGDIFSQRGIQWLESLPLLGRDREILLRELELVKVLNEKILESEEKIREIGERDEDVILLRSIPGIGMFFSVLIRYEIDTIDRFLSAEKLCSYCGLVPSTYSSGGRTYHGRITKRGNPYLRWAFVEAVCSAIRCDERLRSFYERLKKEKGTKVAKVAVAKKLATIAFCVLRRGRPYEISPRSVPCHVN